MRFNNNGLHAITERILCGRLVLSQQHTLSFGLIDKNGIPFPSSTSTIKPEKGGIHPREAADHHKAAASGLLSAALNSQSLSPDDIGAIAYSQGPGLGPCLRVGASIARG